MRRPLYTGPFLLANLVNLLALTSNALFFLFPMYLQQGGLPDWEIGAVMAGFSVAAVLSRPLLGHPMDVYGRRPFICVGLLVCCGCALAYPAAGHQTALLALIRFVHGAGLACYFTAIFTWVADHAPPGRLAEALGFFGLSGLLTMGTGSAAAEAVLAAAGFRGLFLVAAAGFLSACAVAVPLRDHPRERHPDEPRSSGVREAASAFHGVARRPLLFSSTLTIFLFGVGTNVVNSFIAPFIKTATGGAHDVTRFFVAYAASAATVRAVAGPMIDRLGRSRLVTPSLLSLGVGISLLSQIGRPSPGLAWTTMAGMIMGLGHGIIYPALNALIIDRVSDQERGKAMSVFTASTDLGGVVGSLVFGAVASAVGYARMFLLDGVMVAAAVLLFHALERRHGDGAEDRGRAG